MPRTACRLLVVLAVLCLGPVAASAQPAAVPPSSAGPTQVLSANPFGLLIEFFNADYEVRAGQAVTAGASASRFGRDPQLGGGQFVNGDVFVRYYPGGQAFTGRSFGVKVGLTRLPDGPSLPGVGIDANQTWMLNPRFAFSTGAGLKRLIGGRSDEAPALLPSLRFNIGVGF